MSTQLRSSGRIACIEKLKNLAMVDSQALVDEVSHQLLVEDSSEAL